MIKQQTELLKTGEIAKILQISTETVRRMIDDGELEGVRLRPRSPRRVRLEDLKDYAEKNGFKLIWSEQKPINI